MFSHTAYWRASQHVLIKHSQFYACAHAPSPLCHLTASRWYAVRPLHSSVLLTSARLASTHAAGADGKGSTAAAAATTVDATSTAAAGAAARARAMAKIKKQKLSKSSRVTGAAAAIANPTQSATTSNSGGGSSSAASAAPTRSSSKRSSPPPVRASQKRLAVAANTSAGKSKHNTSESKAVSSSSSSSRPKNRAKKGRKMRICVLNSSYEGTGSVTAAVDSYLCTPKHYVKKTARKYTFEDVPIKKMDAYKTIRGLITSGKYDAFFNLCDGGRDESRAGIDVVEALEEMNAAFTGTDSRSFEPSKIDMKLLVGSSGVRVPNFVLLESMDGLAKKCRHLRFPVIVKHLSGYASVGIHKDNRCDNLDELKVTVKRFIHEFNHALVEEFIRGREGTVLACADSASPCGVKVFKPLMFNFLKDADDFAYFEKKWAFEQNENTYAFLPHSDPAYSGIIDMARNAYKYIMNGVGYGRVDFRIDSTTNEPYFLEINPNCGMWYSPQDGGDFADIMVQGDPTWNHERFMTNALSRALREQAARKPWYFISHDKNGQFSTRASKTVPAGKCLFGDAVHPIPVVSKALYKLGAEEPSVGCVICRADGVHQAVAIRHSCEPNMEFVHGRTLLFAAKRQINVGEELTVDYAALRDESMPRFACSCGTKNCRSVIFAMPASPRTVEGKAVRKILREKKRAWLKEKADREAEMILTKRSHKKESAASGAAGAAGGVAGGAAANGHAVATHCSTSDSTK